MKDDEIRKAFEEITEKRLSDMPNNELYMIGTTVRVLIFNDFIEYLKEHESEISELKKTLNEIKTLMNGWKHERIYFHDYDRLKKIDEVLQKSKEGE